MRDSQLVASITEAVFRQLQNKQSVTSSPKSRSDNKIPVGISNRHVHLSEHDFKTLFGYEANLSVFKKLSQPGQFACNEKVTLVGPKGVIENVRILGPARNQTQVEIAPSDAVRLGIRPPIRDSGDLVGTAGISMVGPSGSITLKEGLIIAARHIHMHIDDAKMFGLKDNERVCVIFTGSRSLTFHDVLIRVNPSFKLEMHIDIDEANAACISNGDLVEILK